MTKQYLSRIIYLGILLLTMQYAYCGEKKVSFQFIYGSGIQSVSFDHSTDGVYYYEDYYDDLNNNKTDTFSISTNSTPTSYTINAKFQNTKNGSSDVANTFNYISFFEPAPYTNAYSMELAGSEAQAAALDFWFMGDLYINGNLVAQGFTFAHNNDNNNVDANDWWVTNSNPSRYESGNIVALNLTDVKGNQYCLNQNQNNYQLVVTAGSCSSNIQYNNQGATKKEFTFKWYQPNTSGSDKIWTATFTYDGNHDDMHGNTDYFENIYYDVRDGHDHIYVQSNLGAESGIASSFIKKFNNSRNFLELKSSASLPASLDYWVEGSLTVNDQLIASDLTIALDANSKTWWIGSNSGQVKNDKMLIGSWCLVPDDVNAIRIQTADKCN